MIAASEGIEDFGNYNECDVDGMGAADIVCGNALLTFFVWVKTCGVYRRHISLIMPARLGALARIMHDGEKLRDGCGEKRAIHVANRCPNKLHRVSALRHSRHDRRYAASLRPSICPAQETHN